MGDFEKKCSNCIFCSIDNSLSEAEAELWCDNQSSKYDNGTDILDEWTTGRECTLFKNKNIEYDEELEEYSIFEHYFYGRYVKCQSDNFDRLNNFISHTYELEWEVKKQKWRADELQKITNFIKSELPDVYKRLMKEYRARKEIAE